MLLINGKLVIFLGFALCALFIVPFYPFEKRLEGLVTKVLDGDTLIIQNQKIRLYGIDAPELAQKSFDSVAIGKMSKSYLEELVLGKVIEVTYSKRGYYRRIIGEVWLSGQSVNLLMLEQGMAIFSRYTKRKSYYLASYLAKLKRRGIFATSGFLNPVNYRRKKAALRKRLKSL